jgi:trimethylamine--corrinoid protein Co-methyltransferase
MGRKGPPDAWSRAKAATRPVLETHHPTYLTPEAEAQMRGEFPILLEP